MNRITSLLTLAAALALAGCVPERVVWSPDGTQAAVLADDGLHLCTLDGTLGPVITLQDHPLQAKVAAWLPDGHRLVVTHDEPLATWKEIASAFPQESKVLVANTEELTKVRNALLQDAAAPTADDFSKAIPQGSDDDKWAVVYLRDNEADTLRPKLGDNWKALADFTAPDEVAQVLTLHGNAADAGPPLWHGRTDIIYTLRVSPNDTVIAVTGSDGDHGVKSDITLVPTDGSPAHDLGEGALYPDWTPDGKFLVYIKPLGPVPESSDQPRLGMLVRQRVFDDATSMPIFSRGGLFPQQEELAGLFFDDGCRVRVAKDDRIFFIAADIHLPTTPIDVNPTPLLFSIDPGKQATVSRVVPRSSESDLGDALEFFELSPDNTHLSVPFKDGRVSILDLATGKVDLVQPLIIGNSQSGDQLTSTPTWRPTAPGGELTFIQPQEKAGPPPEVVRYSLQDSKRTVITTTWPDDAKGKWLNRPPTTAPTTQP
jgi:hypothetical protein